MQTINLDLSTKSVIPLLNVKQMEVGRKFKAAITEDGNPYSLAGVVFSVWYSGASGDGNYTNIGDASAFSVSGNNVTVELITQMVANAGKGTLCLVMNTANGDQIATWNIPYYAEAVPGAGSQEATNYYNAFQKVLEDLPYPDTTLSIPGKAADAAAVGAAVGAVGEALEAMEAITFIPEGDDVDRFVKPGKYACETAEIAKTLQGCDVDKAFTLDVRYANGVGPYVGQELRPRDTGARLYRQFVDFSEILSEEAKDLYDRMQTVKPQLYEYGGNVDIYDGTVDISWYTGDKTEYVLEKASQLYGLAQLVNNGTTKFEGVTIKLSKDIVINEDDASTWGDFAPTYSWTPIGKADKVGTSWRFVYYFAGTFDGQGHYISGLYNVQGRDNGFMCYTVNATVKNLAILNSYFETDGTDSASTTAKENGQFLAAVAARGYGLTMENLYTDAILVCSHKDWITGGIIGAAKSNGSQADATGVVHDYGAAIIDSVVFGGAIKSNTGSSGSCVGGIMGGTDGSYVTVKNSLYIGTINANDKYVGGIAGRIETNSKITGCVSAGGVNSTKTPVGAVSGELTGAGSFAVTDCYYSKGLDLYGAQSDSTASVTTTGSKALSDECLENSMVPTKWAKVYDSENRPTVDEVVGAVSAKYVRDLNAFRLDVLGGASVKFSITANLLMFGRVSTAGSSPAVYAFAAYNKYRAPTIAQLAEGRYITVSTSGSDDTGWYIQVDNDGPVGSVATMYFIGNATPEFI